MVLTEFDVTVIQVNCMVHDIITLYITLCALTYLVFFFGCMCRQLFLLFMSFSLAVEALHAFVQDESEHK